MATRWKLPEALMPYTVFERDQVLTDEQLNGVISYLEGQHRITRAKLIGIGNVCGHVVKYMNNTIVITKGCSVTSDGDALFYNEDMVFAHVSTFSDNDANYPYFKNVPLLELHKEKVEGSRALSTLGSNLARMAVLLYLESYEHDNDICTGSDCDNRGREQRNNLKALLVDAGKIKDLFKRPGQYYALDLEISELACERIKLQPENISKLQDLHNRYKNVLPGIIARTKDVLNKSFNACKPLLSEVYDTDPLAAWNTRFDQIAKQVSTQVLYVQYIHNFLNDLADAHNEFREALYDFEKNCCPDVELFPKHVLLGNVIELAGEPERPNRHSFYQSPAVSGREDRLERLRFLHKRIDCLIACFDANVNEGIKVIPSKCAGSQLGDRAIPCYYRVDEKAPLYRYWNYTLYLQGRTSSIVSYHAEKYHGTPQACNPLDYCLCGCRCYRMEGCAGMNIDAAKAAVDNVIAANNLPIRCITVQIESDIRLLPFRPYYWHRDLKDLHLMHRKMLADFIPDLKAFSEDVRAKVSASHQIPEAEAPVTKEITEKKTRDLQKQADVMEVELKKNFKDFEPEKFITQFHAAVQIASDVNNRVKLITANTAFTPFERLLNDSHYKWLSWLKEMAKKREEKARELSTFAKFVSKHPELDTTCCVDSGGTVVLVYSSITKKVITQYSLPHWFCCEALPDIEDEQDGIADLVEPPKKWLDLNRIDVFVSKEKELVKRITDLDIKMKDESKKVGKIIAESVKTFGNVYEGSFSKIFEQIARFSLKDAAGGKAAATGEKAAGGAAAGPYMGGVIMGLSGKALVEDVVATRGTKYADVAGKMMTYYMEAEAIDNKVEAGIATANDFKARALVDKNLANTIVTAVSMVSATGGDIAADSPEAITLDLAKSAGTLVNDAIAKRIVNTKISSLKGVVADREVLASKINDIPESIAASSAPVALEKEAVSEAVEATKGTPLAATTRKISSLITAAETIDKKIASGTATESDYTRRAGVDTEMATEISRTVKTISASGSDVAADSPEAKTLALASIASSVIRESTAKSTISTELSAARATTLSRPVLSGRISAFRIR